MLMPPNQGKRMNTSYYRWWQERWRPFTSGKFRPVAMHFSPQYFEKLRHELEGAGYEVTEVRRELEAAGAEEELVWCGPMFCIRRRSVVFSSAIVSKANASFSSI
jgi:hypothetical protein